MSSVTIYGTLFHHSLNPVELCEVVSRIDSARQSFRTLMDDLHASKDSVSKEAITEKVFSTPNIALWAAVRASRKLPQPYRPTLEKCLSAGSKLNLAVPLKELGKVRVIPKANGGYRLTWRFGVCHRAAQELVLAVLGKSFKPRNFQYTHAGVPKAIAQTKAFLDAGYLHTAHLDVVNQFGSFDHKKLASELPVPKHVVDHVVLGRLLAAEVIKGFKGMKSLTIPPSHTLLNQARQGIPAGSTCSPIVAAFIVSRLDWNPTEHVKLVNLADNFLLIADSASALNEETEKVQLAVAKLLGGHFTLKLLEKSSLPEDRIRFLGHEIRWRDGKLYTTPTIANEHKFWGKANELDTKISNAICKGGTSDKAHALKQLTRLDNFVSGWTGAFKQCDNIAEFKSAYVANVEEHAKFLGVALADLSTAVDEGGGYRESGYTYNI